MGENLRKMTPKLSISGGEEVSKIREQVEAKVKTLSYVDLTKLQEFLKTVSAKRVVTSDKEDN